MPSDERGLYIAQSQWSFESVTTSYTSLCSSPLDCGAGAVNNSDVSEDQNVAQSSALEVGNATNVDDFTGYGMLGDQYHVQGAAGESR